MINKEFLENIKVYPCFFMGASGYCYQFYDVVKTSYREINDIKYSIADLENGVDYSHIDSRQLAIGGLS